LEQIEIIPLAAESLGARSMATFVQTRSGGILIDPGVSLCPNRFGLPPHPIEENRRRELWLRIREKLAAAVTVVVTHYHFDHFEPEETQVYKGKTLYVKHPSLKINRSQHGRANEFLRKMRDLAVEVRYADRLSVDLGSVEMVFSNPVYHGLDAARGFVIQVCVRDDERFVYTSDVQGPALKEQVEFVLQERPDTLYVDGQVTYMLPEAYSEKYVETTCSNLAEVIQRTGVKKVILDHHLTRDLHYRDRLAPVYRAAEEAGVSAQSAAEFLGLTPDLLEARRRELYKGDKQNGK